jgi:hypothetical protein
VLAFLYPSHLGIMKTVAKALQRGVLVAITLVVWFGLVLLPNPIAMAQTASPKPSELVKTTPSPVRQPQAQAPDTGKAVTPAPAKQPENANTKADSPKAGTGGPYDVKAIEDSYKSLYGS